MKFSSTYIYKYILHCILYCLSLIPFLSCLLLLNILFDFYFYVDLMILFFFFFWWYNIAYMLYVYLFCMYAIILCFNIYIYTYIRLIHSDITIFIFIVYQRWIFSQDSDEIKAIKAYILSKDHHHLLINIYT